MDEKAGTSNDVSVQYIEYSQDSEPRYLAAIRQLMATELSEPYSIYVYRYFLYQWGNFCYLVCWQVQLALKAHCS